MLRLMSRRRGIGGAFWPAVAGLRFWFGGAANRRDETHAVAERVSVWPWANEPNVYTFGYSAVGDQPTPEAHSVA